MDRSLNTGSDEVEDGSSVVDAELFGTVDGAMAKAVADLPGRVVVAIGADVVDIDRMRVVIGRRSGFVAKVFTAAEIAYCEKKRDPAERYAVRFAAKESVLKAFGTGLSGAAMTDIEIVRLSSGKPEIVLHGRALKQANNAGIGSWLVTLSHSETIAQAFVAALAV